MSSRSTAGAARRTSPSRSSRPWPRPAPTWSAAWAHFAAAEGWGQLAFFGFIGFLLFAAPSIEPISRPTLVSAVLVVLYLMTPLDIILTWVPVLGRAQVSLQRVQALIPTLEQHARRHPTAGRRRSSGSCSATRFASKA